MQDGLAALAEKDCASCKDGGAPLKGAELAALDAKLGHGWKIAGGHHLEKAFAFPDFKTALAFTNRVGAIAEQQNHHPDIFLGWGKVEVKIWTHSIDGLAEADFVLAAKVEKG